jgi:hypothetical protein
MKRQVVKILLIFLVMSVLSGCKKDYSISDKQVILFQYEYLNYSWDYQHSGYFIDNEGNVLLYDNPEEWNFPDSAFMISQVKLFENLNKCTVSEKRIPHEELAKYSKLIENIASSKVSALKNAGADFGSITYDCYKFDENSLIYKRYLIKMEGDNTCENLNFFSKKVVSWMRDISTYMSIN